MTQVVERRRHCRILLFVVVSYSVGRALVAEPTAPLSTST